MAMGTTWRHPGPPLGHTEGPWGQSGGAQDPLGTLCGHQRGHRSPHTHPRGRPALTSHPSSSPRAAEAPGGAVRGAWGPRLQQAGGRPSHGAAHREVLVGAELLVALETVLEAEAEEARAGDASGGEGDLVPAQLLGVRGHGRTGSSGDTAERRPSARHAERGGAARKRRGLRGGEPIGGGRARRGDSSSRRGAFEASTVNGSTGQSERAKAVEPIAGVS